jgi:arylsulfatase A-like enzyme
MLALLATAVAATTFGPPPTKRNVLYIVYDDLRPDLSAYDVQFMKGKTPNLQRLADTGTLFERAYCQQAVCSPSRNSFTTGRRPNSTQVWNFINSFRNAKCAMKNEIKIVGTEIRRIQTDSTNMGPSLPTARISACCDECTNAEMCVGWTQHRGNCTLFSKIDSYEACPNGQPLESLDTCVSGVKGVFQQWTPLPAHFRNHGYMVLGGGKYYHPGQPADADMNMSWTNAGPLINGVGTIQFPNQTVYCEKWGTYNSATCGAPFGNFAYLNPDDACTNETVSGRYSNFCNPPGFAADGTPPMPPVKNQTALGDFVTYKDAITKMRFAAANLNSTGQPFFQVVGIKRPHLEWRSPPAYIEKFPIESVAAPAQMIMDRSINPIAYTVFPMNAPNCTTTPSRCVNFVKDPYHAGSDAQVRILRQHYYAAVSWSDFVAGKVLDELASLGLEDSTMVVMHSDHGWHLGEYAMWEKRTNWELGTRVPLIIRVPWIMASLGKRTKAFAELVDIYQTVSEVMGLGLPNDTVAFDGHSLVPILADPENGKVKDYALSTFPRCAHVGQPIYGARNLKGGEDNSCLKIPRTDFTWMGYTMRTDRWRYTEWPRWNGTDMTPIWSEIHSAELYDHLGDDTPWTDADKFENINVVTTTDPSVVNALSVKLHTAFGFPAPAAPVPPR